MAAVQRALVHRLQQLEGRDDGAGGQDLDLELAAGHVVDLLREVGRVLVEDVLGRPGALEAQRYGLRAGDHRRGHGAGAGGGSGCGLQEAAARCGLGGRGHEVSEG